MGLNEGHYILILLVALIHWMMIYHFYSDARMFEESSKRDAASLVHCERLIRDLEHKERALHRVLKEILAKIDRAYEDDETTIVSMGYLIRTEVEDLLEQRDEAAENQQIDQEIVELAIEFAKKIRG